MPAKASKGVIPQADPDVADDQVEAKAVPAIMLQSRFLLVLCQNLKYNCQICLVYIYTKGQFGKNLKKTCMSVDLSGACPIE